MLRTPKKLTYLREVYEILQSDQKPVGEEFELLLNNVWSAIESDILPLVSNSASSYMVETFICHSSGPILEKFVLSLGSVGTYFLMFVEMTIVPQGSYVFDTLLCRLLEIGDINKSEALSVFTVLFEVLQKMSRNDVLTLISKLPGSCLYRHILQVLAGVPMDPPIKGKTPSTLSNPKTKQMAKSLILLLIKMVYTPVDHTDSPQNASISSLYDMALKESSSLVLGQCLAISSLFNWNDILEELLDNLLDPPDVVQKLLKDKIGSRVLEEIVKVMAEHFPEKFSTLYEVEFRGKLLFLSKDGISNFVVQRVITYLPSKMPELVKEVLGELKPHFPCLIELGRVGILVAFAKVLLDHTVLQKDFLLSLSPCVSKDCNLEIPQNVTLFLEYLLNLKSRKSLDSRRDWSRKNTNNQVSAYSYLGCQLLSLILQFKHHFINIIKKKFTEQSPQTLVSLCNDQHGSRLMESFIDTQNQSLNISLLKHLEGRLCEICLHPIGYHVIVKFYYNLDIFHKEYLLNELANASEDLSQVKHGKFIVSTLKLDIFKRDMVTWRHFEERNEARSKMFSEFLDSKGPKKENSMKIITKKEIPKERINRKTPQTREGIGLNEKNKKPEDTTIKEESMLKTPSNENTKGSNLGFTSKGKSKRVTDTIHQKKKRRKIKM